MIIIRIFNKLAKLFLRVNLHLFLYNSKNSHSRLHWRLVAFRSVHLGRAITFLGRSRRAGASALTVHLQELAKVELWLLQHLNLSDHNVMEWVD